MDIHSADKLPLLGRSQSFKNEGTNNTDSSTTTTTTVKAKSLSPRSKHSKTDPPKDSKAMKRILKEEKAQMRSSSLRSKKERSPEEERNYHVLLHITGGCWNVGYLPDTTRQESKVKLTAGFSSEPVTGEFKTTGGGVLSTIVKFFFEKLTFETLQKPMNIDFEDNKEHKIGLEIKSELSKLASALQKENISFISRTFKNAPLKWRSSLPCPKISIEADTVSKQIPLYFTKYIDLNTVGWLNFEITLFRADSDGEFIYRFPPKNWEKVSLSKPTILELEAFFRDYEKEIQPLEEAYLMGLIGVPHNKEDQDSDPNLVDLGNYGIDVSLPNFVTFIEKSTVTGCDKGCLWLNDIDEIAMQFFNIFQDKNCTTHSLSALDLFEKMSTEVFCEAFKMYLVCLVKWQFKEDGLLEILSVGKTRVAQKDAGNWDQVVKECEELVHTMVHYLPSIERGQKYYNELAVFFLKYKRLIIDKELKVFPTHDSLFGVISSGLWVERSVNVWPAPFKVSPSILWISRFLMFAMFLTFLTYDVYSEDHNDEIMFYSKVSATMGWDQFDENVSDFKSYWDWVSGKFIPGLYESPDSHILLFADKLLLRQIRTLPIACDKSFTPVFPTTMPSQCYQRIKNGKEEQRSPSWKGTTLSSLGKKSLAAHITSLQYHSEAYTVILSVNETEALETIKNLKESDWIDWGTQAVIIEFLVFNANEQLFAVGTIIAEFSNVGHFVGSHDMLVMSQSSLEWNWSDIVILLFLVGYLLEESKDILLGIYFGDYCGYISDVWNVIDLIFISTGFVYVFMKNSLNHSMLYHLTLQEMWIISEQQQIAYAFGAFMVITAYFRILDYLLPSQFFGVLILTILKLVSDFMFFLILFVILQFGFAAAFHLLYSSQAGYSDLSSSFFLTTFFPTFLGYDVPKYDDVLTFGVPTVALVLQIIYVFITVVLLLNLLIALLAEDYIEMRTQATEEYRWLITESLVEEALVQWPPPFNIIQVVAIFLHWIFLYNCNFLLMIYDDIWKNSELAYQLGSSKVHSRAMWAGMVAHYFHSLKDENLYYIGNDVLDDK